MQEVIDPRYRFWAHKHSIEIKELNEQELIPQQVTRGKLLPRTFRQGDLHGALGTQFADVHAIQLPGVVVERTGGRPFDGDQDGAGS